MDDHCRRVGGRDMTLTPDDRGSEDEGEKPDTTNPGSGQQDQQPPPTAPEPAQHPAYEPPAPEPSLWEWVEKRQAPPVESQD